MKYIVKTNHGSYGPYRSKKQARAAVRDVKGYFGQGALARIVRVKKKPRYMN